MIAGLAVGTAGLTFIASLFYTTVAQSIFMTGLSPFMSALLGLWILRERVRIDHLDRHGDRIGRHADHI